MQRRPSFKHLSDKHLTTTLTRLASKEKASTVELLACLEEFDRRRLYLGFGHASIHAYCRHELHLADAAAYKRIEVARASRRYPVLLDMVGDGRLSLATALLVVPHLAHDTTDALLSAVAYKTKREVETIIACRHPQPPVPSVVRKLPDVKPHTIPTTLPAVNVSAAPAAEGAAHSEPPVPLSALLAPAHEPPTRRSIVAPLSQAHYKLQVTISAATHERLRGIQDLMRHTIPNGDPAAIVERALELLYADLLKRKAAQVARPRPSRRMDAPKGRLIPASVRREVWERDGGRCAFVAAGGKRCGEAGAVEFHHVDSIRTWRGSDDCEHRTALPRAQQIRVGTRGRRQGRSASVEARDRP